MAGAGDIMAGRAFVEVATKDKTGEGLSKIAGNFKKFGAGIVSIGSAIGAGVAALAGSAFAGAVASLAKFAESGSALKDMADRTGLSVENLSELGFAANQTGTDLETVEGAARKMAQTIAKAGAGGKQAVKALADLGLTAQELAGLSPDEQLDKIGKAIAGISNPTTKAAAAMAVFGKSGTKLIPLLGDMAALRSEAERLGLVMSQEDAEAADALGDAWDTVTAQTGSLANQIGAALAPAVTSVLEVVQNLIADAIGWVNANRSIMDSVTDLITLFPTFESAAAVAYLGIQVAALEIVTPILESFAILRSATLSIFDAISAGVKTIWAELMGFIAKGAIDMQVLLGKIPEAIGEQAKMLIDVGVETKKEDIADELATNQAEHAMEGIEGVMEADQALQDAKDQLALAMQVLKSAREARRASKEWRGNEWAPDMEKVGAMSSEAAGAFSSGAVGRLGQAGGASEIKTLIDKVEEGNENTEEMVSLLREGGVFA